jgi:serine/threonine protein phosphatase PrpC
MDKYQVIREALSTILAPEAISDELLEALHLKVYMKTGYDKHDVLKVYYTDFHTTENTATPETAAEVPATPPPVAPLTPPAAARPQGAPPPRPAPPAKTIVQPRPLVLPNAKQGETYTYNIDWVKAEITPANLIQYAIEGLENEGLRLDKTAEQITGTPGTAGDKTFKLLYRNKDGRQYERALQLYVNPDPRSLWTEQEPPEDAPYPKAHTATFLDKSGPKTFVAASKRGRSHAKDGKFRDDDFACHYNEQSGWYSIAVSDGAGSATYSREGSRIACQTAVALLAGAESCLQLLDRLDHFAQQYHRDAQNTEAAEELQKAAYKLLVDTALHAYKSIETEANAREGARLKDYAATLLLSICKKFHFGWFVGTFWVGDGAIGIYSKNADAPVLMGEPDSGEYSGQTRFLTMPEIFEGQEPWKRLRMKFFSQDFDALVLMSDGVSDPLFQTESRLRQQAAWKDFFDEIAEKVNLVRNNADLENELLSWLDFWRKGEYDDRTIAILF